MKQSTRAHGDQQLVSFRAVFLSFSVMLRCSHLDRIESLPIISTKLFHFHFDWIILTFLAIIFELFAIHSHKAKERCQIASRQKLLRSIPRQRSLKHTINCKNKQEVCSFEQMMRGVSVSTSLPYLFVICL